VLRWEGDIQFEVGDDEAEKRHLSRPEAVVEAGERLGEEHARLRAAVASFAFGDESSNGARSRKGEEGDEEGEELPLKEVLKFRAAALLMMKLLLLLLLLLILLFLLLLLLLLKLFVWSGLEELVVERRRFAMNPVDALRAKSTPPPRFSRGRLTKVAGIVNCIKARRPEGEV